MSAIAVGQESAKNRGEIARSPSVTAALFTAAIYGKGRAVALYFRSSIMPSRLGGGD